MDHRQHSAFPELPQQIAALYEWFSARCRWKEKALTQRGLLVQAGDQSEQIFTRWRAGAYNTWSLPGRCFIVLEELRWGHLAMPAVWEARKRWRCCWGFARESDTTSGREYQCGPDHASLLPSVVCLFDRSDGRGSC